MTDDRRYKSYQNLNPHKDRQNYNLTYEEETGKLYYWDAWGNRVDLNTDTPVPPTPLEPATPDTLGGIKTDPDNAVTVDEDGRLQVGGRLGQFEGGGIYYPADMEPENINQNSFLISEAKKYGFNPSKSLGVLTGGSLTCRSAPAGSTTYIINNNYANRIKVSAFKDGWIALSEAEAKNGNLAKVLSVSYVNGEPIDVNSEVQPTSANYRLQITVDKTVNPDAATTSIRGYGLVTGYSTLGVGQCVSQPNGSDGASLDVGSFVLNGGGNFSILVGSTIASLVYNGVKPAGSAIFGQNIINNGKRFVLLQGEGHDSTNGSNFLTAHGAWSIIEPDTKFVIGNGTAYNLRSNLFEVKEIVDTETGTSSTEVLMNGRNGLNYKLFIDENGNLQTEQII